MGFINLPQNTTSAMEYDIYIKYGFLQALKRENHNNDNILGITA